MNSYPSFFPRGGIHIDVLREMSENPNVEEDYLTVDGHPNERGYALFTNLLAQQLSSGIVPALKPCCAETAATRTGTGTNASHPAK